MGWGVGYVCPTGAAAPEPYPPPEGGGPHSRVTVTYHAGVHRRLLNVPCNARDKRIPVLKVGVKVSLWNDKDKGSWSLENRSKVAGWVAGEQTAAYHHKLPAKTDCPVPSYFIPNPNSCTGAG